jgi:NarL family two-component system sensor histidine kinase LiaS
MIHLLRRFRTLQWQLTVSYIMVTVVAVLALEGGVLAAIDIVVLNVLQEPHLLAQDMVQVAPQAAPYLSQTPPSTAALNAWLHSFREGKLVVSDSDGIPIPIGRAATIMVLDRAGRMLASIVGQPASARNLGAMRRLPESQKVIQAALAGRVDVAQLVRTTSRGQTVAAAPIVSAHGEVSGALFFAVNLQETRDDFIRGTMIALLPSAIILAIGASIAGMLFGSLTARGLTRRLRRITKAAGSWSRGELGVAIRDPARDELGQLARDLNGMAEQVQHLLAARQELAVIEERQRLARDLHDSVKQQLFVVTMLVGSARLDVSDRPTIADTLAEAERVAGHAQQELTTLIRALHPVALANRGLHAALTEMCRDWSQRTSIRVKLQLPDDVPAVPAAQQALFRVVQEALTNVARHSSATSVEVFATREQETLALSIQDNGCGFDLGQVDGHGLGLRSMRERVEGVGGTLLVFSPAHRATGMHSGDRATGTRVEARVPLPPLPQAAVHAGASPGWLTAPHDDARRET